MHQVKDLVEAAKEGRAVKSLDERYEKTPNYDLYWEYAHRCATNDPEVERDQIRRLQAFRSARDGARVATALAALERDAREDRNLMPSLIAGVESAATLGEIISQLKTVYGEHRPTT